MLYAGEPVHRTGSLLTFDLERSRSVSPWEKRLTPGILATVSIKGLVLCLELCLVLIIQQTVPTTVLVVKHSLVIKEYKDMLISARNSFKGTVTKINTGAVNTEVIIEITPGVEVAAIITKSSADNLQLVEGGQAIAIVKASDVIVAV